MKTSHQFSPWYKNIQPKEALSSKQNVRTTKQEVASPYEPRVEYQIAVKIQPLNTRELEKKDDNAIKPGLREYQFKIKSRNEINPIVAMPLGSEGNVTEWNPKGLSTKKLLSEKYDEGAKNAQSTVFGFFYTPYTPLSLEGTPLARQVFKVTRGFDIAVSITKRNDDHTISAGRALPYTKLAPQLDHIVDRMVKTHSRNDKTYSVETARHRIGGDIIRLGSGAEIKGQYTKKEWEHLAEFGMVIRADKARAPKSTRYCIDENIRDHSTSFKKRFGDGITSLYPGAPKGGAKKLKERQVQYEPFPDAELTDTSSAKTPRQASRKD